MNDYEYTFLEDVKQKKSVAASARRKKNGSKSKYVGFPSDHMSKKEKEAMNGPVMTYQMNRPMSYKEFKKLPDDLKEKYLACLVDRFGVSLTEIARMMDVSTNTIYSVVHRKKFTKVRSERGRRKLTEAQAVDWAEFLSQLESVADAASEEPAPTVEAPVDTAPVERLIAPTSFSLEFNGKLSLGELVCAVQRVLGRTEFDGTVRISFEG